MMRKRILKNTIVMVVVFTLFWICMPENVMEAKAAPLSHTKATQADVVNGNYYNSKGIQGTEFAQLGDSVSNLNLNHIMLNVDLTTIISPDGTGTPYTYNGKTYYFNEREGSMMKVLLSEVKKYREQGITWTFCLVMSWSDSPVIQNLMYNPEPGKVYYAVNSLKPDAAEHIAATLHFMAERFGYSDTFVQNWRVGNEVNVSHDYNYTGAAGNTMNATLIDLATASYDLLYDALQDENPYARAYVSVTHDWNNSNEGKGVPTKDFIDGFAAKVKDNSWNLDFHAYPPQMKEQVWTKATAQYLTHDVTTMFICGPNLEVLTNYIKDNYGSNHRVIMSEQSYDSTYGFEEQAAMIAQTYYAGVYNDMVDSVIFTTYKDTNSVYHDYYNMGILDIYGSKKPSYDVFKYMNTDQAPAYVDTYLAKLSGWTGRTISSWKDDILYQAPVTTATLSYATLYLPLDQQTENMVFIGLTTTPTNKEVDLEYKWTAFNYTSCETLELSGWILGNEWIQWYPEENATYNITCTVRVAGNPSSTMSDSMDVEVNVPGNPSSQPPSQPDEPDGGEGDSSQGGESGGPSQGGEGGSIGIGEIALPDGATKFASYQGYDFYTTQDGKTVCAGADKKLIINQFMCDGIYTYYFQADGSAMKDRLTYHPDGEHVIYFDKDGHEVFSDFANVKKTIAGLDVDDYCFFDVYGYLYVDVVTYDKTGTYLYYANPYGVMDRGKWFEFSNDVKWADGTPFDKAGGKYGYANADGTLMTNQWTYDWEGRYCYMQGNGVALYP